MASPEASVTTRRMFSNSPKCARRYRLAAMVTRSMSCGSAARSSRILSSLPFSVTAAPRSCTLPSVAAGLL